MAHAFLAQPGDGFKNLFTRHTVFSFFRFADNIVAAFQKRARIIPQANPFGQGPVFGKEVYHRNIIQIDERP